MRVRRTFACSLLLFPLAACGGGGCAEGDGTLVPIPGGYPPADRLDRAGTLRLTGPGLATLADEVDLLAATGLVGGMMDGPVDVAIPRTRGSRSGITFTLCGGDASCAVRLEVGDVALTASPPDGVEVRVDAVLDSRDGEGARDGLPLRLRGGCFLGVCAVNTRCEVDVDTRRGDRNAIAIAGGVGLGESMVPPREGLLAASAREAGIPDDARLERADVRFRDCSGISGALLELFSGPIEGAIVDAVEGAVPDLLVDAVDEAFCARSDPDTGACPGSSVPVPAGALDAICRADDDPTAPCLPTLGGIETQGDLAAAVLGGAFGSGPDAPVPGQLIATAAGPAEVIGDGLSLPLAVGVRTTPTFDFDAEAPAHDACVPVTDPPPRPPAPLARPAALDGDLLPGTDLPFDLGFSVAEASLARALWALFDGGALCLSVDNRVDPMLTTGLLSVFLPSLGELAFPADVSPLRIALRPEAPPTLALASSPEEPLVSLDIAPLALDLYVWSADRYVRALTYRIDLAVALDLAAQDGKLVPEVRSVETSSGEVVDAPLLRTDPGLVARIFDEAAAGLAEGLGAAFPAIDLPALPGLALSIPEGGGPQVLTAADGSRHLAVFADLVPAPEMAAGLGSVVDTRLQVASFEVDPEGSTLEGFGAGPGTRATLRVDALPGGVPTGEPADHAVRLDGGAWTPWQRSPTFYLDPPRLRFEGRHRVEAKARLAGRPGTEDRIPATADLVVDVTPPEVRLAPTVAGLGVDARDLVAAPRDLRVRHRWVAAGGELAEGGWSPWAPHAAEIPASELGDRAGAVEVEVRDPSGNVGRARHSLRSVPAAGAARGCAVGGQDGAASGWGSLVALALGALLATGARRRRRGPGSAVGAGVLGLAVVVLAAGCSRSNRACGGACGPDGEEATTGSVCCRSACVPYDLDDLCDPGLTCASPDDVTLEAACVPGCRACVRQPPLAPGILASHLDAVAAPEAAGGGVWLAGYAPGVPGGDRYGDLVVGVLDPDAPDPLAWEVVDGVPNAPPDGDPDGWRGGVVAPGDDVGRFARIVGTDDGTALVAYQDATAGAVRLARGTPGAGAPWTVGLVDDPTVDAGRGLDLALGPDGAPVLVYQRLIRDPERAGRFRAELVLAEADGEEPAGPADWRRSVLASAVAPCRAEWCAAGDACFVDDGRCAAPSADCPDDCPEGAACRAGVCEDVRTAPTVEARPALLGATAALAITADGLALVLFEDPARGAVRLLARGLGAGEGEDAPTATRLLAGDAPGKVGGNVAVDLVLVAGEGGAVAHGIWVGPRALHHAAFAVAGGPGAPTLTPRGAPRRLDEGAMDPSTGERFDDGRHRIGRDARLVRDPDGRLQVVHQDATATTLRRTPVPLAGEPDGPTPDPGAVVDDVAAAGFFPFRVALPDGRVVTGALTRDPSDGSGAVTFRVD